MAHDDGGVRAHEVLVPDGGHHVLELAGVMAGVEIGTADTAPPHVEYQLALLRPRRRKIHDLEVALQAAHGPHRDTPADSTRCSASGTRSFSEL